MPNNYYILLIDVLKICQNQNTKFGTSIRDGKRYVYYLLMSPNKGEISLRRTISLERKIKARVLN